MAWRTRIFFVHKLANIYMVYKTFQEILDSSATYKKLAKSFWGIQMYAN
jgi:hypothetical protein